MIESGGSAPALHLRDVVGHNDGFRDVSWWYRSLNNLCRNCFGCSLDGNNWGAPDLLWSPGSRSRIWDHLKRQSNTCAAITEIKETFHAWASNRTLTRDRTARISDDCICANKVNMTSYFITYYTYLTGVYHTTNINGFINLLKRKHSVIHSDIWIQPQNDYNLRDKIIQLWIQGAEYVLFHMFKLIKLSVLWRTLTG